MYCLDCGTKINDGELRCPHCGSLVIDMKARIAAAEEKIVYTDAVSPSQTSKLPLVSERSYQDVFGNPLDPSNEVDASSLTRSADDLNAIPTIGDEDPFITKPMQRIVADGGQVVADVDRRPKAYRQEPKRRKAPIGIIFAVVAVVAVLVCAWKFAPEIQEAFQGLVSSQTKNDVPTAQTDQQQSVEPAQDTYTESDFQADLAGAYQDLASWRSDVDKEVEGLEGYYKVSSSQTRTNHADSCKNLIDTISSSRSELAASCEKAGVESQNATYAKYQKIDKLYGYLLDRLNVVYQCWQVSLDYDNPKSHDSEILAPLKSDLKGGNSVSESSFDALYPSADPTK